MKETEARTDGDRRASGKNSGHPVIPSSRHPVIGLIGGIGSGKSTVAAAFARHGARVVSGDQAGHEALCDPEVRQRVLGRWGRGILNEQGEIDRRRLGAVVFDDPAERAALEDIVHPWIEQRLREQIDAASRDPEVRLIVLDAAILLEAGWNKVCDLLVYVHAPRGQRLRRVAEQRGWSAKEVAAREQAQMALADKVGRADDAVDNSGPPEAAARQVDELLRRWGLGD
jgi:dephospho-CoA kinase